jgi:hypothetical protein
MENEFIPYEQALALKELGFDDKTFRSYDTSVVLVDGKYLLDNWYDVSTVDEVKAPLYQQAFRWFREKYDMASFIQRFEGRVYDYEITSDIFKEVTDFGDGYFDTYQEAELECLKKLIEIVKNK